MEFQNLYQLKRFLASKSVVRMSCSRFTGRYTVVLVDAVVDIELRRVGNSIISYATREEVPAVFEYAVPSNGNDGIRRFLDDLLVQVESAQAMDSA